MHHPFFNLKFRPKLLTALLVVLALCVIFNRSVSVKKGPEVASSESEILTQKNNLDVSVDFKKINLLLADINNELYQPNILKEDIERGWYLASKEEKKYGTPETWVFQEDGDRSRWISPNAIDEVEIGMAGELCRQTAGRFAASCLDTADDQCEYVGISRCECSSGTKWYEEQGCVLINEKGSYIAINSKELEQGYYFALPNEKKLNTPLNWIWTEDGPKSAWHVPRKIYLNP